MVWSWSSRIRPTSANYDFVTRLSSLRTVGIVITIIMVQYIHFLQLCFEVKKGSWCLHLRTAAQTLVRSHVADMFKEIYFHINVPYYSYLWKHWSLRHGKGFMVSNCAGFFHSMIVSIFYLEAFFFTFAYRLILLTSLLDAELIYQVD